MIKYYCDICKKEVSHIDEYSMPTQGFKDATDYYGNPIKRIPIMTSAKTEICQQCAVEIRKLINIYQYTIMNNMDETNVIIEKK